jgi:hypothetical protein
MRGLDELLGSDVVMRRANVPQADNGVNKSLVPASAGAGRRARGMGGMERQSAKVIC